LRQSFRDTEHLFRLAILFVAGLVAFLILRALLVPPSFGEFGHYRAAALGEAASLPLSYAGRKACAECHDDKASTLAGGAHANVGCEACHGPQAQHASSDDPSEAKPQLPDAATLCVVCHRANAARPETFPQIDPASHGDGAVCTECHDPHSPL